ncbi:MAG TPA: SurA N-terminal domain-containing protein [Candidatus Acidoferrales bacterium]|nr:SurA N-terminal domain-containing protein [Candidatus Acidoferrales bacterium]
MLDFLRKRKRSWIITFLLGVIIIVFIAFYGGSKYGDSKLQNVAEVNGEAITQPEFAEAYERAVDRYRDLLKGSLTPEMLKSLNLKGSLLEELIQKHLALQEARRLGLTVTDDELVNVIGQVPEFQVAGRFNKDRYLQLLRANKLTPERFEEDQRDQLTIQRLYSLILDSIQVTDAEVRDRYRLEQEKINLQFIRLPFSNFASAVKLTEEDIKKFYDRNKESLKEPLKVQVEYLSYPFDAFASKAELSAKEIEDYYQANRETKFHSPKQAKVRYIAIRLEPTADAKQKDEARARAARILAEARSGKDFAQLAKQDSNDPSAAKGGDLGWVSPGQFPPPLDKAIFSLPKGGISDAVETPGGLQIVKVEDLKEEKTQSLKEATPEISRILKTEKGKREAAIAADRDREKALSGVDFVKLAQDSGAPLNTTRWFSNGEVLPELGQNPEFYKTALSLSGKDIGPVIEGRNAYYLLRLKDKKEPAVPPLDTVRPVIEKDVISAKSAELARQKANAMLDQLKKEKDIAKVAAQNNVSVEETGFFLRNAPQVPKLDDLPDVKTSAMTLSAQKPLADRVYTNKDAAYLLAFKEQEAADMQRFEKEKDQLTKQALAENRQRIAQKFMEGLKAKAKIDVHAATLEEG